MCHIFFRSPIHLAIVRRVRLADTCIPKRSQCCCIWFHHHTSYAKPEATNKLENGFQYLKSCLVNASCNLARSDFYGGFQHSLPLVLERKFSSKVKVASRDKEDDLEDEFSDLDVPPETVRIEELSEKTDDKLLYEQDSDEYDNYEAKKDVLGLFGAEAYCDEKEFAMKIHTSQLYRVVMEATRFNLTNTLEQWVEAGNSFEKDEIFFVLFNLRNRWAFGKALQFMEWLEETKRLDYGEREYSSHLFFVGRLLGIQKAESYFAKIPECFKGELVYRTLLAIYVAVGNVKKSEEVFYKKIKDLCLPISVFACDQLILLYKRMDPKKICDVLNLMKKEDIKPSSFTYWFLIESKGSARDIVGMEEILATMKSEGINLDLELQATVARSYILSGKHEKAEEVLKEMEGNDIKNNRSACRLLLPLHATLGKIDDVRRIWSVCEDGGPHLQECLAAIEAWGRLGKVEDAERVFEKMMILCKNPSSRCYDVLLKVYAHHKLLSKGKELAKRMSANGCKIKRPTWDALVKLYVKAGEVEKADLILQKASEQDNTKPFCSTLIYLLAAYAGKGDVHNAEKMFHRIKQMGYTSGITHYHLLLKAYVNSKTSAYGIGDRMKADNIFPNKATRAQLEAVNPFRKTQISNLFE